MVHVIFAMNSERNVSYHCLGEASIPIHCTASRSGTEKKRSQFINSTVTCLMFEQLLSFEFDPCQCSNKISNFNWIS